MENAPEGSGVPAPQATEILPTLLPGECILNIIDFPRRRPEQPPSSVRELYRLADAKLRDDTYEFHRPVFASLSLDIQGAPNASHELGLYEALFGRDSLRVAIDVLPRFPALTRTTILELAKLQGTETHLYREEEPGRIIHESRNAEDPIAMHLTEQDHWQWPYYGSVDATPEFIKTIAAYTKSTTEGGAFLFQPYVAKDGSHRVVADALTSAVEWTLRRLDDSRSGFLEYKPAFEGSIENQVWRDSWDSYTHRDGNLANHKNGIASAEVQAIVYDALLDASEIYEHLLDRRDFAHNLRQRADELGEAALNAFWTDERGGFFVLGIDRDRHNASRQIATKTSNMGHLLHSQLLMSNAPEMQMMRDLTIKQLFSDEMLNVSGIRTLARSEGRFRPGAYHNGSVWLWDTYYTARGLQQHGYYGLAQELIDRLYGVINTTHSYPEYVRGGDESTPTINTRVIDVWDENYQRKSRVEQPPQEVQAWSVAAMVSIEHHQPTTPTEAVDPIKRNFEKAILDHLGDEKA